jgi:hypothetical protein
MGKEDRKVREEDLDSLSDLSDRLWECRSKIALALEVLKFRPAAGQSEREELGQNGAYLVLSDVDETLDLVRNRMTEIERTKRNLSGDRKG